jgi:hypothetical protein
MLISARDFWSYTREQKSKFTALRLECKQLTLRTPLERVSRLRKEYVHAYTLSHASSHLLQDKRLAPGLRYSDH